MPLAGTRYPCLDEKAAAPGNALLSYMHWRSLFACSLLWVPLGMIHQSVLTNAERRLICTLQSCEL